MENLARQTEMWDGNNYVKVPDYLEVCSEVSKKVIGELEQAKILTYNGTDGGEVPTSVIGYYKGWVFRRRWYYYSAEGPGIPPDIAEEFHQKWGQVVRVEGHCGCPSPKEWCKGFGVGSYHIDTMEGLIAFHELLESIH